MTAEARVLRAATRGSRLALWQTRHIAELIGSAVEIVVVETEGDRTQRADVPLESVAGRGVFVKEVQAAVLDGRADFAVHSAKDMPSTTPDGLVIAAVPERGDPRDALVGCRLEELPQGALIATGSSRRRAQLASMRPDLTFKNLRGNVDTRITKIDTCDALVMAYAPIQRLELSGPPVHPLDTDVMVPQVAQGALAVECRIDDGETIDVLARIEHRDSRRVVDAERAFLQTFGGDCSLPVGAYATVTSSGSLEISGLLASFDGSVALRHRVEGVDALEVGKSCASALLESEAGRTLISS